MITNICLEGNSLRHMYKVKNHKQSLPVCFKPNYVAHNYVKILWHFVLALTRLRDHLVEQRKGWTELEHNHKTQQKWNPKLIYLYWCVCSRRKAGRSEKAAASRRLTWLSSLCPLCEQVPHCLYRLHGITTPPLLPHLHKWRSHDITLQPVGGCLHPLFTQMGFVSGCCAAVCGALQDCILTENVKIMCICICVYTLIKMLNLSQPD